MADESIQCHDDPNTCDTVSSLHVPIIFVPGVMGSRLDIISGRSWDPDDATAMGNWLSLTDASVQKTRSALRGGGTGTPATPATTKTKLYHSRVFSDPIDEVYKSARCRAIGKLATGKDDKALIGDYYGEQRSWASICWGFYGSLLMRLESELNLEHDDPCFPVFACGYDWRAPNEVSGAKINAFIRKVLARYQAVASDAIVITHSMGGLAVRAGMMVDGSIKQKIRGVIHGLQPSLGAVVCYRRFLTGTTPPADRQSEAADYVLNSVMGKTGPRYAYNLSGCPGPLQLLPNHVYSKFGGPWLRGMDSSYDLNAVYDIYRRFQLPGIAQVAALGEEQSGSKAEKASHSVRADFAANINRAETFHKGVEQVAHDRTYVIYTTGLRCDQSIEFLNYGATKGGKVSAPEVPVPIIPATPYYYPPPPPRKEVWRTSGVGDSELTNLEDEITYHRSPDGDGTVPVVSAECPSLSPPPLSSPQAGAKPLEHSKAYGDADFQILTLSYIHRLLSP
ncbi:MAG TPA: hypothetical protein VFK05_19630 [Polyangiaceae bacterium]|nr:hypothetical protein [Polyangiaceae bacterium]